MANGATFSRISRKDRQLLPIFLKNFLLGVFVTFTCRDFPGGEIVRISSINTVLIFWKRHQEFALLFHLLSDFLWDGKHPLVALTSRSISVTITRTCGSMSVDSDWL